jgi:uncharacterized protein (TIGR02284 family)
MPAKANSSINVGPHGTSGRSVTFQIARDQAKALNHLIHLGHDLLHAYEEALRRLHGVEIRQQLRALATDHGRHIKELGGCVEELGQPPARGGDVRTLLGRARVVIAQLGGDAAILQAMAANEAVLFMAYRRALAQGCPPQVRAVLERALADEERHRAAYDRELRRFVE